MSQTIDQKVVEMKFDNTQFEAGVKQTITSLDELKTALNLNTATTGINTLQGAFDSFKIDNIQNSLDELTSRFSTLGIVGMTAIQNITNKLTDLATNKISSVIGQIKSENVLTLVDGNKLIKNFSYPQEKPTRLML